MTRRAKTITGGAVAALIVLGAAMWWVFIRGDEPAAVSIDEAVEAAEAEGGEAAVDGFDGTWSVDPSVGSFDDFSGSFAGYRMEEELAGIGANTAVGRTPDVSGALEISGASVDAVDVTVDVSTLESDESRRDQFGSDGALETDRFPEASFALTEPIDLGGAASPETLVSAVVPGELTLHGVTSPVTFEIEAEVVNGLITATGKTTIELADFDITPPAIGPVVSIADRGEIEFQLFFAKD